MQEDVSILIVEDETVVALDLKKYIETNFNISVVIVNTVVDAVMTVEKVKPNLILMDVILKGKLNGIDAAEIITKKYKIPIIYLTALSDSKFYKNAEKTNPAKIITKPYEEQELMQAINSILIEQTNE